VAFDMPASRDIASALASA